MSGNPRASELRHDPQLKEILENMRKKNLVKTPSGLTYELDSKGRIISIEGEEKPQRKYYLEK